MFGARVDIAPMTNAAPDHAPDGPRQLGRDGGFVFVCCHQCGGDHHGRHGTLLANNARLAVSFSLMFEAGGQPISGAGGVIPDPIEKGLPDLPTNAFFQYGVYEGVPRILDLMDKHQVKLSSFMIGQAVEKAPDLAREIVKRGHEAAAHGRTWQNSYFLDPEAERKFIADSVETIQKVTGQQPIGWNAYWMRNSPHTLDILQSLGFKYHIDEPSMDEPFIVKLKGGDFVTVPYTFHMNDIVSFPFEGYNPAATSRR
jgi:hypothetical protein